MFMNDAHPQDMLMKAVSEYVRLACEKEYEKMAAEMVERFAQRKAEIMATALLWVTKQVDVQRVSDRITFTLAIDPKKS